MKDLLRGFPSAQLLQYMKIDFHSMSVNTVAERWQARDRQLHTLIDKKLTKKILFHYVFWIGIDLETLFYTAT